MALLLPGVAAAHTGGEVHSFVAGVMHPLGGVDHLMAMLAVGLLAGCAGGWMRWALPGSFVAAMAMGAVLGANGIEAPFVEAAIAFSLIAFGAALVTRRSLSAPLMIAFTAGFAMFHGHAHGTEMAAGLAAMPYAMGFMIATALLHATGVLLTTNTLLPLKQLTLRKWSGSAIAAAGIASLCVTIVSA
ncbi:HupE/UreJ family protein [Steroidobacter sp. S1-65]|uniref:HupE/UreJ family protein n=1 Tax=Steroidobacter gossypii TaxID=2805490 RepID=A0ABS1WUZ4_9GAMM|nr:HupE/UreJ family protein [Steroidobacter gossypii]MBM0104796.1 HupE/UreJ family protein [Steroidobacter gossypii]